MNHTFTPTAGILIAWIATFILLPATAFAQSKGQVVPIDESNCRIWLPGADWTADLEPMRTLEDSGRGYQRALFVGPGQSIRLVMQYASSAMSDATFERVLSGMTESTLSDGGTVGRIEESREYGPPNVDIWCATVPMRLPGAKETIYAHVRAFTSDSRIYVLCNQWPGPSPSPEFLQLAESFEHLRPPVEPEVRVVNSYSHGKPEPARTSSDLVLLPLYVAALLVGAGAARLAGMWHVWWFGAMAVGLCAIVVIALKSTDPEQAGALSVVPMLTIAVAVYLARAQQRRQLQRQSQQQA